MKIAAIRLREVGCFARPTVMEGLTGGLDVLAQPNEAGKSTLFRALRAVLFEKHSTQARELQELRPYNGGAPLIEVDFETSEGAFRLRKQFLSAPSAELKDLAGNIVIARGAEAHERALALIGVSGEKDPFGLFWVAQGQSIEDVEPGESDGRALGAVIEGEVKAVTGGRRARAALEWARIERHRLISTSQGRPRGDYSRAIQRCQELAADAGKARADQEAAEAQLTRLSSLREQREGLRDPARWVALQEATKEAQSALERARSAQRKWQETAQALKLARAERDASAGTLNNFDRKLRELANLDSSISTATDSLAKARQAAAVAKAEVDAAVKRLAEAGRQVTDAETLVRRIAAAADHVERVRIAASIEQAQKVASALAEADAVLALNRATPVVMARIEAKAREVEIERATVAASAPTLSIAYLPDAEGRARVEGKSLAPDTPLQLTEPLTIEIESVGALTIHPGASAGERIDALHAADAALAGLLADFGVADLSAARRLGQERQAAEEERTIAMEKLAIHAPDGIDALERRLRALPQYTEEVPSDLPDRESADAALSAVRRLAVTIDFEVNRLKSDAAAAEIEVAKFVTELKLLSQQREQRAAELPLDSERAPSRAKLADELADRELAVVAKLKDAEEARAALGDMADIFPFEQRLARAVAAERMALDELSRCERDIAGAEGELKSVYSAGIGEKLEELEDQLAEARARVQRFEREVKEFDLLISALTQAAAEARDAFFRPVVERLRPMLQQVFPSAEMEFAEGFRPGRLIRGPRPEDVRRLSGGTREQVAVLVRLAFARLMADGGRPAPVILDDALVYAGDERLDPLFDVLRMAASRHQVMVLTCHARAFAPLGGNSVTIEAHDFV